MVNRMSATTFDLWLEGRLRRDLLPITAVRPPRPRYLSGQAARSVVRLSLAVAFAVATLALTGIGALAATLTGSVDPQVWGQQVRDQVQSCKESLRPGQHGIGECVSDFARQHGPGVAGAHPATLSLSWLRARSAPASASRLKLSLCR